MAPRALRSSPQRRQEEIIRTSIRLFAKHGFAETSFQMIADSCQLSQSAIMHHFKNKSVLLENVLKKIVTHNHEIVTTEIEVHDDAFERLRKHFSGNLSWALKFPEEAQIILLLYYLACFTKNFSKIYEQMLATARNRILELLAAGQREGLFLPTLDLENAAELLHDSLLGGIVNVITLPRKPSSSANVEKKWMLLFQSTILARK